ncbi:Phosphomutase-like protein 3 [Candida viswanathii]|uniref:Phosphomutase-like protein 3 n=1 Tax=Candida viswanathii TaxID=5486 RepID=A0A367YJH5_9ASCO|nr:Phosphomutase-like protein 3 [Candida viswanathii]
MIPTNILAMVSLLYLSTAALSVAQVVFAADDDDDESYTLPKFESSTKFFAQSDPDIDIDKVNVTDNFGLETDKYTWQDVISSLSSNEKLFLIQRHGEGWHNVAPSNFSQDDWDCYWQEQQGYDGVIWADAELTPNGVNQIQKLSQQINNTEDLPWPTRFFVSPLRRTLETWQLTWSDLKHSTPLIKESARETYGIQTESQRHNKSYIIDNFPGFDFEDGFTELDELWKPDSRETGQHRKYRAALLLTEIFANTTEEDQVISLVSHLGLIGSILDVVGHRDYPMQTGGLIPVVIHKKKKKTKTYTLDKPNKTYADVCPNPPESISGAPSDYTTIAA